jgi:ABC-type sugar transport system permease subunit
VGLENYLAPLSSGSFVSSWRILLIFAAVPVELAIGFGLAYLLRQPFRGRGVMLVAAAHRALERFSLRAVE